MIGLTGKQCGMYSKCMKWVGKLQNGMLMHELKSKKWMEDMLCPLGCSLCYEMSCQRIESKGW